MDNLSTEKHEKQVFDYLKEMASVCRELPNGDIIGTLTNTGSKWYEIHVSHPKTVKAYAERHHLLDVFSSRGDGDYPWEYSCRYGAVKVFCIMTDKAKEEYESENLGD